MNTFWDFFLAAFVSIFKSLEIPISFLIKIKKEWKDCITNIEDTKINRIYQMYVDPLNFVCGARDHKLVLKEQVLICYIHLLWKGDRIVSNLNSCLINAY